MLAAAVAEQAALAAGLAALSADLAAAVAERAALSADLAALSADLAAPIDCSGHCTPRRSRPCTYFAVRTARRALGKPVGYRPR